MKIGFPYMGCVTGYQKLLELLGHEVIVPDKPTQRTVDLGVLYSPEFICYPFKVMMGTYVELCERGVEVIVSSGGTGPCRAGMYGEIHKKILKQIGYDVDIIIYDSMFQDIKLFVKKLLKVKNKTPLFKAIYSGALALTMISQMDEMEKELKIKRAYEIEKDSFDKCFEEIKKLHLGVYNFRQLKKVKKQSWDMLNSVPVKNVKEEDKLRIGIVGEIYVIMESTTNMELEKRLNSLGVEVCNVQYISDWLKHNIIPKRFNKCESWKAFHKSDKYKAFNCGGHDKENTGWIMEFADRGFDGVVHLMPFGCLPELITRSMIPQISEDYDIPILSMSMDEQQGEANTQTRVEAFIDLCRSKKNSKGM